MATGQEQAKAGRYRRAEAASGKKGRWPGRIVLAAALAGVALLLWSWHSLGTRALVQSAYAARVACSCHYVGKRDFAGCEAEVDRETSFVFLSRDEEAQSVSASVPLLSSQSATYRPGAGCMLEKWRS